MLVPQHGRSSFDSGYARSPRPSGWSCAHRCPEV